MYPYNLLTLAYCYDSHSNHSSVDPIVLRPLAFAGDIVFIAFAFLLTNYIPLDTLMGRWAGEVFVIFASPLLILVFAAIESSNFRASPGKLLFCLVTVNNEGFRLSFKRSLLRNTIKWLPFFIFPIACLILRINISDLISTWLILIGTTTFLVVTLHDWITGSKIHYRPSLWKLRHNSHDRIIF